MSADDLRDRLELHELFARYAWSYDEGRFDQLADLWTVDAQFEIRGGVGTMPTTMRGRDEIVTTMQARRSQTQPAQRRHLITNVVVEEVDGDRARASAYLVLGSTTDGVLSLPITGHYRNGYARVDGRWRIHRQVLTMDASLA